MRFLLLLLLAGAVASASVIPIEDNDEPLLVPQSLADFNASLPLLPRPVFALFCDVDAPEACESKLALLRRLIKLNTPALAGAVDFAYVNDLFMPTVRAFPVLPDLPRLQLFDANGGAPRQIPYFQTSKLGEFALERFLLRALSPAVVELQSTADLAAFLTDDDGLRDAVHEDPVSFVLVEPERGSLITRTLYYAAARARHVRSFFAHLRVHGPEASELEAVRALCNLSATVPIHLPAVVRVETGRRGRMLTGGSAGTLIPTRALFEDDIIHLGPHNFRDVWEASQAQHAVLALGLYRDETDVAALTEQFTAAQEGGGGDEVWYAMVDRALYADFFVQFVEPEHLVLAMNRTAQVFWVKTREGQGDSVSSWVRRILAGEEPSHQMEGLASLWRLGWKAFQRKPVLLGGLLLGISAFLFAVLGVVCMCTAPSTLGARLQQHAKQD